MYRGKWFSLVKLKILGLGCGTDFDFKFESKLYWKSRKSNRLRVRGRRNVVNGVLRTPSLVAHFAKDTFSVIEGEFICKCLLY